LTVVNLDNIWYNNQLKQSSENICPKVAAKNLHDPDKLGHFQKRVRRKLMNLHRLHVQNRGNDGIAGKPQSAGKEVAKHDNFTSFGSRDLFIQGCASGAHGKKSRCLVLSDQIGSNLRFPADKRRRKRLRLLYCNKILHISADISDVFLL
jgi:hypothetical protein